MISGALPFEWAVQSDKIYSLIIEERYDEFWQIFSSLGDFSEPVKDLIQGMLQYDPKKRLRVNEIVEHEWVLRHSE
jgi:serine/threonine protein kinase